MSYDLLSTVEYGGCSAKLSPKQLSEVLDKLPKVSDEKILVDIDTHDDAGVYKLNDEQALIFTTDFFPPVCSDPYTFGQIAAANALSDVYAMGGTPILALNLMMFSANKMPMDAYTAILQGGFDKVQEAGAFTVGGHTIEDFPPKYGLAVVGLVHPSKLVTNAQAQAGDLLVLTKPLGIGTIVAGQRLEMVSQANYQAALEQMSLLNKTAAGLMAKYNVKAATDVTGFGLLGHGLKLAEASRVSMHIHSDALPLLPGAYELMDSGCVPGAAFRNLEYCEKSLKFRPGVDYSLKMLALDAQTSGGMLICVKAEQASALVDELLATGLHPQTAIIGEVVPQEESAIYFD